VVLGPGYGDDIQLIKAGLLEIADIVVVNKCDLPGATRLLEAVREELEGSSAAPGVRCNQSGDPASGEKHGTAASISIFGVEAKSGAGMDEVLEKLLDLDRTARIPEQREHHRYRRVLGEIRRSATLMYEQALERALAASTAKELLVKLEGGELSLETIVTRIGAAALANLQPGTDQDESPGRGAP